MHLHQAHAESFTLLISTPGFGNAIDSSDSYVLRHVKRGEACIGDPFPCEADMPLTVSMSSFQEIVGYLERQYDDILAEESRIKRNPRFRDNRVHALLYFIPPSGHQ